MRSSLGRGLLFCTASLAMLGTAVATQAQTSNPGRPDAKIRIVDENNIPLANPMFVIKRADGSTVEPVLAPDGSFRFLDVDTKLIIEFVARDMKVRTHAIQIDPEARHVYLDLYIDPQTGLVKEVLKKFSYPKEGKQHKIRNAPAGWGGGPVFSGPAGPANDFCADALEIFDGDTAYSTVDATTDGPQSDDCQFDGQTYHDVWYTYTATCTGTLTVSTCGTTDYDSDLVVYDGEDCGNLAASLLGCQDDLSGCDGFTSMVDVPVTVGNAYLVRIGGFNDGDFGTGMVNLTCTPDGGGGPANDDCADATAIFDGDTAYSTIDATTDGPQSDDCMFDGQTYHDIWYAYTATCTGTLTVSTCGTTDYDSDLVVYDGTDCANLGTSLLGCNDDTSGCDGFTSMIGVPVTEGNSYLIRIGGFNDGDFGTGTVNLTCEIDVPMGPPNDECDGAIDVGCNSSTLFDNTDATTDPTDPEFSCHFSAPGQGEGTMWYTFEATHTSALLETNNSFVSDTLLAVYSGTCGSLVEIACSEDEGVGLLSELCATGLNVGETYYVQVASFSASSQGMIQLDITCPCPAAPDNDNCADAEGLALPASVTFSNEFATDDQLVPCNTTVPVLNVWYSVMGTGNTITASTCNAGTEVSDTIINVFCGDCFEPLCVAGNDDACDDFGAFLTTVSWGSQAGVEYLISIGNFPGAAGGRITMEVTDDGEPADVEVNCLPIGACCLADGTCVILTAQDCEDAGGSYNGDDTACDNNSVADGSFEGGTPSADWLEASDSFGSPLCTPAICGTGGGTGPRTGDWWIWFGGIFAPETASMEQTVTIPVGAESLGFYLEIPVSSGNGDDFMTLSIDGDVVFTATEADGPFSGYQLRSVDVQALADGGSHTIRFDSSITGLDAMGDAALSNFFVDDVAINTVNIECRDCFVLDFETQDDWVTSLVNGEAILSPPDFGNTVLIAGFGGDTFGTAIFDSNPAGPNAGGPDPDLLIGQGNILILQERGFQSIPGFYDVPDDAQLGGLMEFRFVGSVELDSVDLIDIDPGPPVPQDVSLVLIDGSGKTRTYFVPGGWTNDLFQDGSGGVRTLSLQTLADQPGETTTAIAFEDAGFNRNDVVLLNAFFTSSGALDNLTFCQEGSAMAPLSADPTVSNRSVKRR